MIAIVRRATALAATLAFTAACSSTAAPAAKSVPPPGPAAANVDVSGFKFPANVDITAGTKVVWTNKDGAGHTITSGTRPNKDGKFDSPLPAGGTFTFTFATIGTFNYFCTIHSSMNGTLTVR